MASAPPPTFGQFLKRYRTAAGLTQEALAQQSRSIERHPMDLADNGAKGGNA